MQNHVLINPSLWYHPPRESSEEEQFNSEEEEEQFNSDEEQFYSDDEPMNAISDIQDELNGHAQSQMLS